MYVPNKPAGQTHWIPVKADEPSHGQGASRAFYGTTFKDVSGCRAASVITQLRPRISFFSFFFFLIASECIGASVWGKFFPPKFLSKEISLRFV